MNFSVGVTLKINLSPGHIRSGTVLKYVWEDGDGRERTEMRPLGGAGRVIWRVPSALAHLTQAGWPQHTPPHTPAGLSRPRMGCRHKAEAYKCWCDVLHVPMCALSHLSPPREHKAIEGKEPHPASPGGTSHQHTAQKSATLSHVIPQQISWFSLILYEHCPHHCLLLSGWLHSHFSSWWCGIFHLYGDITKRSQVPAPCAGH